MADELAIAVVGLALRVPGADTPERYWEQLQAGRPLVTRRAAAHGGLVPVYGELADPEAFDPSRYAISEAEAILMDPQHRVLLDVVDEALCIGNVDPGRTTVSLYGGVGLNDYAAWVRGALAVPDDLLREVDSQREYAVARAAFRLGLRGAAVNVQTACSTALVTIHLAAQDLLSSGSDVAVAAVAAVRVPGPGGYAAPSGGIGSPDGVCRPFDVAANGTVPGDGAGAVVLKRLKDALAAHDEIYAVIRGSAVNNDGADKSGFAGVSARAQRELLRAALAASDLTPGAIDYVEAHGSGTRLGDATEWAALADVFAGVPHPVHVGAAKASVGHLREAAGLAGFVKTLLSLRHGRLAPTPGFGALPEDLARRSEVLQPLAVGRDWCAVPGTPRRGGVSAFGLGGTNCHVVLEETPPRAPRVPARTGVMLVSSHSVETLAEDAEAMVAAAEAAGDRAGDMSFTSQAGRRHLRHRRFVTLSGADDGTAGRASGSARRRTRECPAEPPRIGLIFPGVGNHYAGMGVGLARGGGAFARHLGAIVAITDDVTEGATSAAFAPSAPNGPATGGVDLRAMLRRNPPVRPPATRLRDTHLGLFAFELALARTLADAGVRPDALLGHSLGEWVVAVVAGILSPEDAIRAVARRADLIEEAGAGAMLAALAPAGEVARMAGDRVWLAADNSHQHCVFSGRPDAIAALARALTDAGIARLAVDMPHPFHTPQLDAAAEALERHLEHVPLAPPGIPVISCVSGERLGDQAREPGYWARQLAVPVRFRAAAAVLLQQVDVVVEVGPGSAQSWVASARPTIPCVRTVRRAYEDADDETVLQEALGQLWLAGAELDWTCLHPPGRQRVSLPRPSIRPRRLMPPGMPQRSTGSQVAIVPAAREGQEPARAPLDVRLREQWRLLLGVEEIADDDHFFELGGDSLMGVRLVAGLAKITGATPPTEVVFHGARFGEMLANVGRWIAERDGDGRMAAAP